MAIEQVLPKNYFVAIEHLHACLRIAGFNFFQEFDEDHRVTEGSLTPLERLKYLTETLEQI